MHVMLSRCVWRGHVESGEEPTVRGRTLGAEARVCAPAGRGELRRNAGVALVPIGGSR
jgi:hypothetical protein